MNGPGQYRMARMFVLGILVGLALSAMFRLRAALQVDSCFDRGSHWVNGACEGGAG